VGVLLSVHGHDAYALLIAAVLLGSWPGARPPARPSSGRARDLLDTTAEDL
jgi:hypothetical protein